MAAKPGQLSADAGRQADGARLLHRHTTFLSQPGSKQTVSSPTLPGFVDRAPLCSALCDHDGSTVPHSMTLDPSGYALPTGPERYFEGYNILYSCTG